MSLYNTLGFVKRCLSLTLTGLLLAGSAVAQTDFYQGTTEQQLPIEINIIDDAVTTYSGEFRCTNVNGSFDQEDSPGCSINANGQFDCGTPSPCDGSNSVRLSGQLDGDTLSGQLRVRTAEVIVSGEVFVDCCAATINFSATRDNTTNGLQFSDSFEMQ